MNITMAFTLSVIMSILFAAFNGPMYGVLTFIITLPIFLFTTRVLETESNQVNNQQVSESVQTEPHSDQGPFAWPELTKFRFRIDGEPQYQPVMQRLASRAKKTSKKNPDTSFLTAYIIPDEENKLVQVKIDNQTVGYFNISDTRSYRRRLSAKKISGQTTTCLATIADSYSEKAHSKQYNVLLDLKPFA